MSKTIDPASDVFIPFIGIIGEKCTNLLPFPEGQILDSSNMTKFVDILKFDGNGRKSSKMVCFGKRRNYENLFSVSVSWELTDVQYIFSAILNSRVRL